VDALSRYWAARGYLAEGRRWLEAVLAMSDDGRATPSLRLRVVLAAATQARRQGDLGAAERLLAESLAVAHHLGDRPIEAEALAWLASTHCQQGAAEVGLPLGEEALAIAHESADEGAIAFTHAALGVVLRFAGAATRSVDILEEGLRRYRRLEDQRMMAVCLTELGLSLLEVGDLDRAGQMLRDALHVLRVAGEQRYVVFGLLCLAQVSYGRGEVRRAARLLSASEVQRESIGMRHAEHFRARVRTLTESLRQQLSKAEFDELHADGEAMSLDQVLAEIGDAP